LAAVAQRWADQQGGYGAPIAVEMRAQRDQRFVAVYRCWATALPPEALLLDQVMEPADWEAWLVREGADLGAVRVVAETELAASVAEVLAIAQLQFQQGQRPDWAAALPFYGQHPVAGCT
jgi:tRNA A37 threonylcarbamoyladenosine modification protein TsaB